MRDYGLFDKPLRALDLDDLTVLRSTYEGWHVDYKKSLVHDYGSLAKHVSSFANSYGGWLFFGVDQVRGNGHNTAGAFVGIPDSAVPDSLNRLRVAATQWVSPPVYYSERVLAGPSEQLSVPAGRSIVAVKIPQSDETPHIHKDGRIYRRKADSSEPESETNRVLLDQLWERRRNHDARQQALEEQQTSSAYFEPRLTVCHLLLRPAHQQDAPNRHTFTDLIRLFTDKPPDGSLGLVFDHFQPIFNGVVARSVNRNPLDRPGITFRLDTACNAVVSFPLSSASLSGMPVETLRPFLRGYNQAQELQNLLRASPSDGLTIVDLNFLVFQLWGALAVYLRLLSAAGLAPTGYVRGRVFNMKNRVPFLDVPAYTAQLQSHGIPFGLDADVWLPGAQVDQCFYIEHIGPPDQGTLSEALGGIVLAYLNCFGLLAKSLSDPDELVEAMHRAVRRQGG